MTTKNGNLITTCPHCGRPAGDLHLCSAIDIFLQLARWHEKMRKESLQLAQEARQIEAGEQR